MSTALFAHLPNAQDNGSAIRRFTPLSRKNFTDGEGADVLGLLAYVVKLVKY